MLPNDVTRCGGHAPHGSGLCPRKNECARYLTKAGPRTPFVLSFCEAGFIHAETVVEQVGAGHPYAESSERVMDGNALRTGGAL